MSNFAAPPSNFVVPPDNPKRIDAVWSLTRSAQNWLTDLSSTLATTAQAVAPIVTLTAQGASIGATAFSIGAVQAALYRVSGYARITTAATTGAATSSLIVTINFTESTLSLSQSTAAITGNTISTVASFSFLFRSDRAAPITYSATYASDTASQMKYRLSLVCELVG